MEKLYDFLDENKVCISSTKLEIFHFIKIINLTEDTLETQNYIFLGQNYKIIYMDPHHLILKGKTIEMKRKEHDNL